METTFNVPSTSCSICTNRIKNELGGMGGIEGVDIDMKSQTVMVRYNPSMLEPQEIKNKIAAMGYEVIQ